MAFSCFDNTNYDYTAMANKPMLNGVTLQGDMNFEDLGLTDLVACCTQQYADDCIYPYMNEELDKKQGTLTEGQGICITEENEISVNADPALDCESLNAVQNCVVTEALNNKQNTLIEGTGVAICDNTISVDVDLAMSTTSTKPVANCAVSEAITCIMSCGYSAGNGICMTTDECGCFVISLAECINVPCDLTVNGKALINCPDLPALCHAGLDVCYKTGEAAATIGVDCNGKWSANNKEIATIDSGFEDMTLAVWNDTCKRFDCTETMHGSLNWNNCTDFSLCHSLDGQNEFKLKGTITCSDRSKAHCYESLECLDCDLLCETTSFSRYDIVGSPSCGRSLTTFCGCFVVEDDCHGYAYCNLVPDTNCTVAQAESHVNISPVNGCATYSEATCPDYTASLRVSASSGFAPLFCGAMIDCVVTCCDMNATFCASVCPGVFGFSILDCSIAVNTSGTMCPWSYSNLTFDSNPSYSICDVYPVCYYIDDLGTYCADCCYFCYDSGNSTYCSVELDAESYSPSTYYFNCLDYDGQTTTVTHDLYFFADDGTCAKVADEIVDNGVSTSCADVYMHTRVSVDICNDCCGSCLSADTMCCIYWACGDIVDVHFVTKFCRDYTQDVWLCQIGNTSAVHSIGADGQCVFQERLSDNGYANRYYSNGCWSDWSIIPDASCLCKIICPATICPFRICNTGSGAVECNNICYCLKSSHSADTLCNYVYVYACDITTGCRVYNFEYRVETVYHNLPQYKVNANAWHITYMNNYRRAGTYTRNIRIPDRFTECGNDYIEYTPIIPGALVEYTCECDTSDGTVYHSADLFYADPAAQREFDMIAASNSSIYAACFGAEVMIKPII